MKNFFNVRSVSLGVQREIFGRVVLRTVTYEAEIWGMRMDESHKLDVKELK